MKPLREVLPEQKRTRASGFGSMSTSWLLPVLFLNDDSRARGYSLFPYGETTPVPQRAGRAVLGWAVGFLFHFRVRGTVRMDRAKLEWWLCLLCTAQSCSPDKVSAWRKLPYWFACLQCPWAWSSWTRNIYFCYVKPDLLLAAHQQIIFKILKKTWCHFFVALGRLSEIMLTWREVSVFQWSWFFRSDLIQVSLLPYSLTPTGVS